MGDGKNSFFFNHTKINWNINKIMALENGNDDVVFGHSAISEVAAEFFKNSIGYLSTVHHSDFFNLGCPTFTNAQAAI